MRHDGGVAIALGDADGIERFGERANLVDLDQQRIGQTLADAHGQPLGVGDEQVIADQLDLVADLVGHGLPAFEIVLAHAVFDRDDRVIGAERGQVIGHFDRAQRKPLAADFVLAVLEEFGRRAIERERDVDGWSPEDVVRYHELEEEEETESPEALDRDADGRLDDALAIVKVDAERRGDHLSRHALGEQPVPQDQGRHQSGRACAAAVPAGRIYTVADIAADPHYQARDMIQQVQMDDGTSLAVPGIIPKLSRTPGSHRRNAPTIGQDTDAVLGEMGLTAAQIQALKDKGIVA